MPKIHILDLKVAPKQHGISLHLIEEIKSAWLKRTGTHFPESSWLCARTDLW